MTEKSFHLEVITPDRSAVDAEVLSVQASATDGMFGVLARHAPLIIALEVGPLRYKDLEGRETVVLVGDGFAEVHGGHMKVLGDFAEFPGEIDRERAQRALERARQRLGKRSPEIDAARAEASLRRAIARLRMAGGEN